jgi:hypothetical protein
VAKKTVDVGTIAISQIDLLDSVDVHDIAQDASRCSAEAGRISVKCWQLYSTTNALTGGQKIHYSDRIKRLSNERENSKDRKTSQNRLVAKVNG